MRIAIAAIFKNEGPYVLEWLAHHISIGFDDFYVADNESDDGTSELLCALDKLGILHVVSFPTPAAGSPQLSAYEILLKNHAKSADWIAFIDADEFLVPESGQSIRPVIAVADADPMAGAIAVNWAVYGSSGHEAQTSEPVTARFTQRANQKLGVNKHFKSIIRPSIARVGLNPHSFALEDGRYYVSPSGQKLNFSADGSTGHTSEVDWSGARINHYVVKSRDEFFRKKRPRGRATTTSLVRPASFFAAHDQNEVTDPMPKAIVTATEETLRDMKRRLISGGNTAALERAMRILTPAASRYRGTVDAGEIRSNRAVLRGWAVDENGATAISRLSLQIDGIDVDLHEMQLTRRSDVMKAISGTDERCGFEIAFALPKKMPDRSAIRLLCGNRTLPVNNNFQWHRRGTTAVPRRSTTLRGYDVFDELATLSPRTAFKTIFDVGANIGQSVRKFKDYFPSAEVWSFEAVESTYNILVEKTRAVPDVKCFHLALSSESNRRLKVENVPGSVDNRLVSELLDADGLSDVTTISGDDLCRERGVDRIDYLKIDTEGHDLEVIKGFRGMLAARSIGFIEIECGMNRNNAKHIHINEFMKFFEEFKYDLFGVYEQVREQNSGTLLRRANLVFTSVASPESTRDLLKLRNALSAQGQETTAPIKGSSKTESVETISFICGCGHSGTSLLANMFAAHPDVFIPLIETNSFINKVPSLDKFSELILDAIHDGKNHFLEKTPKHIIALDTIRGILPSAKFIIMVRDGRDVAASFVKRFGSMDAGFERWVSDNKLVAREKDADDVMIVRYESLIENPQSELEKVCRFIGMPFSPSMLEYHKVERRWFGQEKIEKGTGRDGFEHNALRNWQVNQPIFDGRGAWKNILSADQVVSL